LVDLTFVKFHLQTSEAITSRGLEGLSKISASCDIVLAKDINLKDLFTYGEKMTGSSSCSFQASLLSHDPECGWAAVGEEGQILGYLIMGKTTCPDSYRVGPLYADDAALAQSLLKKAVEYAAKFVLLDALP
jgi:hypothetical protein